MACEARSNLVCYAAHEHLLIAEPELNLRLSNMASPHLELCASSKEWQKMMVGARPTLPPAAYQQQTLQQFCILKQCCKVYAPQLGHHR